MVVSLAYRPREGFMLATGAGMTLRLATLPNSDIAAWQAAARAAATTSRIEPWLKTQEIRSGSTAARGLGDNLAGAETAALEIYDYPGAYAQRFDGTDRPSNHRQHSRVLALTRAPATAAHRIAIHAAPSCGNPCCIVIAQPWDLLFDRLRTARQVRIVVEL